MKRPQHPIFLLALLAGAACTNGAGSPESSFERGRSELEKGDPRTARIEFLNAIKARPNDPKVRLAQSEAYLALRDGAAAQAEVERARKLGASLGETAHLLAHALLLQGRHQQALKESEAAASDRRGYASWVRGLALMALGDAAGAEAAFQEAKAAAPADHRVWTAFARFRRDNGDAQGALRSADKAVALKPNDVEALTLRGELTRSQYGLLAAMPWFNRALEVDPNNEIALLERAATLGDMGRMEAMLADTRKVLSLSGSNSRAFYLQAMLAARAGNFRLAQSLYQRTGGRLDDQPATMLLASAIDYQTGNVQQAITRLVKLVQMQPGNRKARRLLAASQWRLGDATATIETLRPIADLGDADLYTLTLMGRALASQGASERAAFYLARAAQPQQRSASALSSGPVSAERLAELRYWARTDPGNAGAQIRLIGALLSSGLGNEALERARSLQLANPGVPDAHVLVGDALGMRGDFAGAAEQYRKAANLAFTEPTAMRMIEALERSGQAAAAAHVLQIFLQQNPRSVPAQLLAANAYLRARNWPAAILAYEGLRRRLGDRDAAMLNNLAWAYSEQGDYERAIPLARRAWTLDKSSPATADTLGWLLVKSGRNKAEGLVLLERAARGAPTDAEIRRHLSAARKG
jgi:tetratricopeptide (TPR) repeat protein